jgi:hypothetical protein
MKASLVSQELIADSIELVSGGHMFDALACIVLCDKTVSAAAMALARLDRPRVILFGGTILPGTLDGRSITAGDVFEAIGAHSAGTLSEEDLRRIELAACPVPGACGAQFTANTMSMVMEAIGLSPVGYNAIPAVDESKPGATERAAAVAMVALKRDLTPGGSSPPWPSRTRLPSSPRAAARRTRCSTCWRWPVRSASRSRSTTSTGSAAARRSWPTSCPVDGSRRSTCTGPVALPSSHGA